jgi:hypothetical protein
MHLLKKIPCTQVELRWDRELSSDGDVRTRQLRGALAEAFANDDLFHQHDGKTGKPLYRYPLVQYRWRDGHGVVIGWGEAAGQLLTMPWLDLELRLGDEAVIVGDAALTMRYESFEVSERLLHYRLLTPTLLLKSENYRRYQSMNELGQRIELDRLLVSNILMALRGLDVNFPERLYAAFTRLHIRSSQYKGQEFLGISGELVSNAALPDGFSFGHAVSHGFGWLMTA